MHSARHDSGIEKFTDIEGPKATGSLGAEELASLLEGAWKGPITSIRFELAIDLSTVCSLLYGKTHSSFPQPNGLPIKEQFHLAIGSSLTHLQLVGFDRTEKELCLVLNYSNVDQPGPLETRLYWNEKSGYERSDHRLMRHLREAFESPGSHFEPIDITPLVSCPAGVLSATFPTPSGGNSGKQRGFGAGHSVTSVTLIAIEKDEEGFKLTLNYKADSPGQNGTSTLLWCSEHGYETPVQRTVRKVEDVFKNPSLLSTPLDVSLLFRYAPTCSMSSHFPHPLQSKNAIEKNRAIGVGPDVRSVHLEAVSQDRNVWKLRFKAIQEGKELPVPVDMYWIKEFGYLTPRDLLLLKTKEVLQLRGVLLAPFDVSEICYLDTAKLGIGFPLPHGMFDSRSISLGVGVNVSAVRIFAIYEEDGTYLVIFEYEKGGATNRTALYCTQGRDFELPWDYSARRLREALEKRNELSGPIDVTPLFNPSTAFMSSGFPTPDGTPNDRFGIGINQDFTKVEVQNLKVDAGLYWLDLRVTTLQDKGFPLIDEIKICWEKGYGYETERGRTERLMRAVFSRDTTVTLPLDISPTIRLGQGLLAVGFPTPDGKRTEKAISFHAPQNLEWVKWLTHEVDGGTTKMGLEIKPFKSEKPYPLPLYYTTEHGYETQLKKTSREFADILRNKKVEAPLDISALISLPAGTLSPHCPTPKGERLKKQKHLGLPKRLETVHVIGIAEEDDTLRIDLLGKRRGNSDVRLSIYWNDEGRYDSAYKHAVALAKKAIQKPSEKSLPVDISKLVHLGSGVLSNSFPQPDGQSMKNRMTFGAGYPLSRVELYDVVDTSPQGPLLTLRYHRGVAEESMCGYSRLRWDGTQYHVVRDKVGLYTGMLRGRIFDHLLTLAVEQRGLSYERSLSVLVSEFTEETRKPNITVNDQYKKIIHGKWGGHLKQCFQLLLAYERLHCLHPWTYQSPTLVVVDEQARNNIRALASAADTSFMARVIAYDELLDEVESSASSRREGHSLLSQARHFADAGDVESLLQLEQSLAKRVSKPFTQVMGAPRLDDPARWQMHLRPYLEEPAVLYKALDPHEKIHSLFWEESYHFQLLARIAYCMEQLPGELELREIAHRMYPDLVRFEPGEVWQKLVILASRGVGRDLEQLEESVAGSRFTVAPFDLSRVMRMRNKPRMNEEVGVAQEAELEPLAEDPVSLDLPSGENPIELANAAIICLRGNAAQISESIVQQLSDRIARSVKNVLTADSRLWEGSTEVARLKQDLIQHSLAEIVGILDRLQIKHLNVPGANRSSTRSELLDVLERFSRECNSILDNKNSN